MNWQICDMLIAMLLCRRIKNIPILLLWCEGRMSKSVVEESGDLPLFEALKIAEQTKLPLMVTLKLHLQN